MENRLVIQRWAMQNLYSSNQERQKEEEIKVGKEVRHEYSLLPIIFKPMYKRDINEVKENPNAGFQIQGEKKMIGFTDDITILAENVK